MSWTLHRWVWELQSPLSVGMAPAGALNRCRLYVPGRAVWGAVTAELVQSRSGDFGKEGEALRKNARFSYLFPAERNGRSWCAWLPRFEANRGLRWVREDDPDAKDSRSDREFRRSLLEARAGTAISPETDSAADGSLRETECLATRWRMESNAHERAVALVGYVFLRDGADLTSITTLFLGGDARYGLSRAALVSRDEANNVFGAAVRRDGKDSPQVSSHHVFGHALANRNNQMTGALERVAGWDRNQTGLRATGEQPLWVPGSKCTAKDGAPLPWWQLETDGIWSYCVTQEAKS